MFSFSCFLIHISEPIFPRKRWPFPIFHFLQNGNHSWLISKFSNILKTTPVTLTCISTFILTLPSQELVLSWVKTGTSRNGRWLWQMLILRNLKFMCLKLLLYVLGKFAGTYCFNETCFVLKSLYLNPLHSLASFLIATSQVYWRRGGCSVFVRSVHPETYMFVKPVTSFRPKSVIFHHSISGH